jgi:hypothetical protein
MTGSLVPDAFIIVSLIVAWLLDYKARHKHTDGRRDKDNAVHINRRAD